MAVIKLVCPQEPECNGEYIYQYVEPMSELNETVIECEKCGRFLKTSQPFPGVPNKEEYDTANKQP